MRVLAFEIAPSSTRGGQELSMVEELEGLAALGHDVTLAYAEPGDLLERYERAGVRTIRVHAIGDDRRGLLWSLVGWSRTLLDVARVPADVVLINGYYVSPLGRLVSSARRVPLVCHLRLHPPDGFSRRWTVGLRGVSRFVAVSRGVRDEWVATGQDADRIDVVYDGVNTDLFRPSDARARTRESLGVPPDAFVVLYGGRLDRYKRLELLLESFAELRLPPAAARLLVAGAPVEESDRGGDTGASYVAELQAHAARLGIADAVQWLGSRRDVPELMNAADCVALFSPRESFGRTTVEALACGVPPVVAAGGGSSELLSGEFAQLLFDPARPSDATRVLASCIGWRERDPGFARRAREHARRNFSVAAMVEGAERSLERAVREGRSARPERRGSVPRPTPAARR